MNYIFGYYQFWQNNTGPKIMGCVQWVAPNIGLVANAVGLVASCYVDLCMLVS